MMCDFIINYRLHKKQVDKLGQRERVTKQQRSTKIPIVYSLGTRNDKQGYIDCLRCCDSDREDWMIEVVIIGDLVDEIVLRGNYTRKGCWFMSVRFGGLVVDIDKGWYLIEWDPIVRSILIYDRICKNYQFKLSPRKAVLIILMNYEECQVVRRICNYLSKKQDNILVYELLGICQQVLVLIITKQNNTL